MEHMPAAFVKPGKMSEVCKGCQNKSSLLCTPKKLYEMKKNLQS